MAGRPGLGLAALAVLALVPDVRLSLLVQAGGQPDPQGTVATVAAYAAVLLALVSSATVGAVLASRRPGHPVGWLLLGVGLAVALSWLSCAGFVLLTPTGLLPSPRWPGGPGWPRPRRC